MSFGFLRIAVPTVNVARSKSGSKLSEKEEGSNGTALGVRVTYYQA